LYDLIIRSGLVVDGSGAPPFPADICIQDGIIADISPTSTGVSKNVINAQGKVVSPGFLDIHSHSDLAPLAPFQPESMLYQGVTFELCGNCGISILPSTPASRQSITKYFSSNLQYPFSEISNSIHTMDDYAAHAKKNKSSIHYGMLIGHGSLRGCIMGFDNRNPTQDELERMKHRLDQELSSGAFGMSLGLIYPPSAFAETQELEELARVVRKHNGILSVHIRNEGARVFESVKEMLDIAEHTGVRLEISHLKIMTKSLWGQADQLLELIDSARLRGVDVCCDQYPFHVSSTSLTAVVPKWAHDGGIPALQARVEHPEPRLKQDIAAELESRGGASCVLIASTHGLHLDWEGQTIAQLAERFELDAVDTILTVLKDCHCSVNCNYFSQNERDMLRIIERPDIAVGSDGYDFSYDRSITVDAAPHPRSFCTFPRALEILRENKLLSLEAAVHKMTGLPAKILGIQDRGILSVGNAADITIFDANTIGQSGDFMHPFHKPKGIEAVIVSGQVVLDNGKIATAHPGSILRHGSCCRTQ